MVVDISVGYWEGRGATAECGLFRMRGGMASHDLPVLWVFGVADRWGLDGAGGDEGCPVQGRDGVTEHFLRPVDVGDQA